MVHPMPRNRPEVAREDKIDDIVRVAERALREGGYEALSLSGVAQELGLARGAIYWYFATKDDLLVAAAKRIFDLALANPPAQGQLEKRVEWAMEQLAILGPVTSAVHDRAYHSEAVAAFEEAFHQRFCDGLRELLRPRVAAARLEALTECVVVFVRGLLAMSLKPEERRSRLRFFLRELVPR
jgi:AcrR family transcriptional regulator